MNVLVRLKSKKLYQEKWQRYESRESTLRNIKRQN